jgi:hypothetical protein
MTTTGRLSHASINRLKPQVDLVARMLEQASLAHDDVWDTAAHFERTSEGSAFLEIAERIGSEAVTIHDEIMRLRDRVDQLAALLRDA